MTQLSDLVPALQRELAVPGTFEDVFPDTTADDLADSLADGFAEAQLRGFFSRLTLEGTGPNRSTSEDLSAAGQALVVIFTSIRIIRAQIRALSTGERYKAGNTEYEINRSAMLLRDELAFLTNRLDDLIAEGKYGKAPLAVVIDGYLARNGSVGAFYAWERP